MTNTIRAGRTCLLSSASNAWLQRGYIVSEPELFVLGAGNRVDYQLQQRDNVAQIFLGHHSAEILADFCARYAIPHQLVRGPCELEALTRSLRLQLESGHSLIAWVRMSALPYWPGAVPPGAMHAVAIERLSGTAVTIADCYVTQGFYSTQVQTRRLSLDLPQFCAWQSTDYLRHEIDCGSLCAPGQVFRPSAREIAAAIDRAARDFLGAQSSDEGSASRLRGLADALPVIYAQSEPAVRQSLFRSLAYSIQHFGCLWSREFLGEVMQQHAAEIGCSPLAGLGKALASSRNKWKSMSYLAFKVSVMEVAGPEIERLRSLLRATIEHEETIYTAVLALRLSGLNAPTNGLVREEARAETAVAPRFGFGSNLGA